jgi:histone H3/H4
VISLHFTRPARSGESSHLNRTVASFTDLDQKNKHTHLRYVKHLIDHFADTKTIRMLQIPASNRLGYVGGKNAVSEAKSKRAINSEGVAVIDDMIKQLHNTIVMTAKAVAKHNNRVTLSAADVALAVKIHTGLVGDVHNTSGSGAAVFKDVTAFANQAVTRWQESLTAHE